MADEYVTVSGTLKVVRPKSVLFEPEDEPASVWIPRSLVHGADETRLDNLASGERIDLRVFEWFAEKEGLI